MILGNIKKKILSITLIFVICTANFTLSYANELVAAGQDKRNQLIFLLEICELDRLNEFVTRAEFAKMIVKASEFKETIPYDVPAVTFEDVDALNEYSQYIKKAVSEKYMVSYLSNQFRPNNFVTYKEVARGVLALLGYENSDFAGNQTNGRFIKFHELFLSENVSKNIEDNLTKQDIINIFYNLMKTTPKNGSGIYGAKFNLVKTNNNELDGSGVVNLSFYGPILISKDMDISSVIPFDIDNANYYLNNTISSKMNVIDALVINGYAICYYNKRIKALQIFCEGASANVESSSVSLAVGRGYVEKINLNAGTYQVPYSIQINNDTYYLESAGAQMAFSNFGSVRENDEVIFIFDKSGSFGGLSSQNSYRVASVSVISRTSSGISISSREKNVYTSGYGQIYKCILGIFPIIENMGKTHFGCD